MGTMGLMLKLGGCLALVLGVAVQQVWVRLEDIVQWAVTLDNPRLEPLRIGYTMAGGADDGAANIASAIKETLIA